MICPRCGYNAPEGSFACPACGTRLISNPQNTPNYQSYNQYNSQNPVAFNEMKKVKNWGDAAFVLSILALILTVSHGVSLLGLIFGIIAWVKGAKAYKMTDDSKYKAAKIMGIISTVIATVCIVAAIIILILGVTIGVGIFSSIFDDVMNEFMYF